ncbi:protein FAM210A-like isoform X2 [Mizuhopecten yessoensis]|uniref:protein FAM210A-like isoform X2 n=1 Tax=Mizuhopecten yessoensis TaxID=6573 RepID=UPI000B45DE4E|nr:protein FAM210A-like isoform X2 [Mizuhopecten yessoensis]
MRFSSNMFKSAHMSIRRTVRQFCRQQICQRHALKVKEFVRARPWIWTSRKTAAQGTYAQGYQEFAHDRTIPVLVNKQIHPSDWVGKQPLIYPKSIPLFGSRGNVNYVQFNHYHNNVISRQFSVRTRQQQKSSEEIQKPPEGEGQNVEKPAEQLTLIQRFKKTYKEHGKVLVAVHVLTSCVWFGSFYAVVDSGVDIVAMLEWMGFSETITNPFKSSSMGNVALAYLMYKLATPARYTVTIGGTNMAIKHLMNKEKMSKTKKEDKIRSLFKEGVKDVKDQSTRKFKQYRFKARAKRNAAKAQSTKKVKAVGKRVFSRIKWRRDKIMLKLKTSRLNRKGSKKENGNSDNEA